MDKVEHLKLLQAIVRRMADNSFKLKTWVITLVSALYALAAANARPEFVLLAYVPALAFWMLDGYYLHQERLFKELYDHVRSSPGNASDFSMDTSVVKASVAAWHSVCLSRTLAGFYLPILCSIIIVMLAL